MNTTQTSASLAVCAAVLVLASAPAFAATSEAQQRYNEDRAACMQGRTNQDRATCLKEAGAALQEARRGQLDTARERELQRNRLARCDAQSGADKDDCIARMQAGNSSGSAQGGGILRESSRPDTAK